MSEYSKRIVFWLCCAAICAAVSGCSKLRGFGWGTDTQASKPGVSPQDSSKTGIYFTETENLPLYQSPGSKIITRLPLHTKVYRDDLQKGYAHVRVDATGDQGWIENAKLIWRLPKPAAQDKKPEPASDVANTENSKPSVKPAEPVAPLPSDMPDEPTVPPSIFNPY